MNISAVVLLVVGLVLLVAGAEMLVRGASGLARIAGISPLVIGLTVVAYGTSAPELAVSLQATYARQPSLALGNVVGSNIFNVLFILGAAAVIRPLVVSQQLIRVDVPVLIALSLLAWTMCLDTTINRFEGLLLCVAAVGYTLLALWLGRREAANVKAEYEEAFGRSDRPAEGASRRRWLVQAALVVVGLCLLLLGARWLVNGAVEIARFAGVSELVIGLTIVAAGTSLPEVATSILASVRGQQDIAVGNVVGSCVFNLAAILGLAAAAAPTAIDVAPPALRVDIPVMVATAVACLPMFFTGARVSRPEGLVFLALYAAYTTNLVLAARGDDAASGFGFVMLAVVLPLFAIGVLGSALRAIVSARYNR